MSMFVARHDQVVRAVDGARESRAHYLVRRARKKGITVVDTGGDRFDLLRMHERGVQRLATGLSGSAAQEWIENA